MLCKWRDKPSRTASPIFRQSDRNQGGEINQLPLIKRSTMMLNTSSAVEEKFYFPVIVFLSFIDYKYLKYRSIQKTFYECRIYIFYLEQVFQHDSTENALSKHLPSQHKQRKRKKKSPWYGLLCSLTLQPVQYNLHVPWDWELLQKWDCQMDGGACRAQAIKQSPQRLM